MLGFLGYTLEAGFIFAVLAAFYKYVCRGCSYNKWERGYILGSTALSYLLPLLKVRFYTQPRITRPRDTIVDIVSTYPVDVVTLSHQKAHQGIVSSMVDSQAFQIAVSVLMAVYIAGAAAKLVSMANGLRKTIALRSGEFQALESGIRLYRIGISTVAFSFFRSIFLGTRAQSLSPSQLEVVLAHEKGHIRGWHSIDTLVFGIYSALQWMNPMVRVASQASRAVCENIADSNVPGGGAEYSRLILQLGIQARSRKKPPRESSGALMQRIARLLSSDTDRIRRIRFVCSIPALALTIAAYLVLAGMARPVSLGLEVPVKGKYRITAGFFENQRIMDCDGILYSVSHRQMDIAADTSARIVAPADCRVEAVSESAVAIRCGDTQIEIGGLATCCLTPGDAVKKHQPLGKPSAGGLIYLKAYKSGKPRNPELVFDF